MSATTRNLIAVACIPAAALILAAPGLLAAAAALVLACWLAWSLFRNHALPAAESFLARGAEVLSSRWHLNAWLDGLCSANHPSHRPALVPVAPAGLEGAEWSRPVVAPEPDLSAVTLDATPAPADCLMATATAEPCDLEALTEECLYRWMDRQADAVEPMPVAEAKGKRARKPRAARGLAQTVAKHAGAVAAKAGKVARRAGKPKELPRPRLAQIAGQIEAQAVAEAELLERAHALAG